MQPKLSVVIPLVERTDHLKSVATDYMRVLNSLGVDHQIIYVIDNASPAVEAFIDTAVSMHPHVSRIKLSKSYGDSTALTAGLDACDGDHILILPPHAQIEAEDIPKVLDHLKDFDFVAAERNRDADSMFNRAQGKVFNKLINWVTDTDIRDIGCEVRAMKREVAEQITLYGDLHQFLPLLAHRLGFRVGSVQVRQSVADRERRIRQPGIYIRRLLDVLNVLFLLRFTKKPLRFFGLIGASFAVLGAIILAYVVFERLAFGVELGSRPPLFFGAMMVIVGIQILAVGLIGEIVIFTHAGELKEYQVEKIVDSYDRPARPIPLDTTHELTPGDQLSGS